MNNTIQYIVTDNGIRTSVIIPFDKWEKINSDYRKLHKKLEVLLSIQDGFREIKRLKRSSENLQTLSDFLNECNNPDDK